MRAVSILLIFFIMTAVMYPAMAYPAQAAVTVKVTYMDGTPVEGASVTLQNGNYTLIGSSVTDPKGECIIAASPGSAAIRAVVTKDDGGTVYNVSSIWYEPSSPLAINVKLPDTGEVTGTIRLDGMGAGNPLVVLDDARIFDTVPYAVSQQDGSSLHVFNVNRFDFRASLDDHTIYAVGYSNGTVYRSDRLSVKAQPSTPAIVLELKPAGNNASVLSKQVYDRIFHTSENVTSGPANVSGRLVGADGMPVQGATMVVQDYYMREPASTTTGVNGTYAFQGLVASTDVVRFKISINDNGTSYQSYTRFYPLQNSSGMDLQLSDYPAASTGYIYGIIVESANRSNPVALNGTVYLSNGQTQEVSLSKNQGQFFFSVTPGTYEIYAVHQDGNRRFVSQKMQIDVQPTWSVISVNPTLLVVEPEKMAPLPFALAVALGIACLCGCYVILRRKL